MRDFQPMEIGVNLNPIKALIVKELVQIMPLRIEGRWINSSLTVA